MIYPKLDKISKILSGKQLQACSMCGISHFLQYARLDSIPLHLCVVDHSVCVALAFSYYMTYGLTPHTPKS